MLGLAIVAAQDLLIIDEPTSSIDPQSRQEIWEIIKELKKKKELIVIMATHHLEEADFLSDQIVILAKGKVVIQGEIPQIKQKFG